MRPIPRAKMPMSYDQDVDGPYLISRMPHVVDLEVDDFEDAIDEFVRYCLPPFTSPGMCSMTDANGVIAIGYISNGLSPTHWVGVRWAVDELRAHPLVDALLITTIEMALEPR